MFHASKPQVGTWTIVRQVSLTTGQSMNNTQPHPIMFTEGLPGA